MCGAALTPGDINYDAHVSFAPYTFLFGVVMVTFYVIAIILNEDFSNKFAILLIAYTLISILAIIMLIVGRAIEDTPEGIMILMTTIKVSIYAEVITLLVLAFGAMKLPKWKSSAEVRKNFGKKEKTLHGLEEIHNEED